MGKRRAGPSLTIGPEGVQLTPFADEICLQEDLEVSLVSLPDTVQEVSFPLCLVAASVGHRRAVRPSPSLASHQVPRAMSLCSVEMPSGHALFPFADSPHITQEGFIIHGSNPEARAKVYRLLLHIEIVSNPHEAAQEVLLHLDWIQEADTPTRVFPFNSLQYLEHRPTLPPAKRRAALWLTPQPDCQQAQRPPPHFQVFRPHPAGRPGVCASQASQADFPEPISASSHHVLFFCTGGGAVCAERHKSP